MFDEIILTIFLNFLQQRLPQIIDGKIEDFLSENTQSSFSEILRTGVIQVVPILTKLEIVNFRDVSSKYDNLFKFAVFG